MELSNKMLRAGQIQQWWQGAKAIAAWLNARARLLLGGALLLASVLALAEHEARVRRDAEVSLLRREAIHEVSALRAKAESAIEDSRASERAIRDLESRRAKLERDAENLRAHLQFLRKEERADVRPASTPGHTKMMAGGIASPPDPASLGIRDSGLATRDSELGAAGAAESQISDSEFQKREASALAGGMEFEISDYRFQRTDPGSRTSNSEPRIPNPESRVPSPAFDNCREQVDVQDRLIANCEAREELSRAALEAAKQSARDLREALDAKDAIAARLDAQHRAELRAARGSRLGRFGRAVKYIGVGVVIGIAVAL